LSAKWQRKVHTAPSFQIFPSSCSDISTASCVDKMRFAAAAPRAEFTVKQVYSAANVLNHAL